MDEEGIRPNIMTGSRTPLVVLRLTEGIAIEGTDFKICNIVAVAGKADAVALETIVNTSLLFLPQSLRIRLNPPPVCWISLLP